VIYGAGDWAGPDVWGGLTAMIIAVCSIGHTLPAAGPQTRERWQGQGGEARVLAAQGCDSSSSASSSTSILHPTSCILHPAPCILILRLPRRARWSMRVPTAFSPSRSAAFSFRRSCGAVLPGLLSGLLPGLLPGLLLQNTPAAPPFAARLRRLTAAAACRPRPPARSSR
jgi:hypothetical protein